LLIEKTNIADAKPKLLQPLFEEADCQGMSFELCGSAEPHLVKYDFEIALKPLFLSYNNGRIKPVITGNKELEV